MLHLIYRRLTGLAGPAVRLYLDYRQRNGKEDPVRRGERLGHAGRPRPPGPLVWVHGASVGEANSALVLLERLLAAAPTAHVLLTTGTVSSARIMADRLPERAFHQFAPVDLPDVVERFLDHWRPDAALWMESELWPNQLNALNRRGAPVALVNARMSARSFRRWGQVPKSVATMLAAFRTVLAQSPDDAGRLRQLGAANVACVGNLKFSAAPPPVDAAALADLRRMVGDRPVWLFSSSHPGEEAIAAQVHRALAAGLPGLLTIIAPRHPPRGGAIADELAALGLRVARRSAGEAPTADHDIYLADTMGELGLFYCLAPVACMGGSFVPHGGQNPIEPAQLGAAVLYGPHMFNFSQITERLETAGAAQRLTGPDELAPAVRRLLTDPEARAGLIAGAARVTEDNRRIVDGALSALWPLLEQAGVVPPRPDAPPEPPAETTAEHPGR